MRKRPTWRSSTATDADITGNNGELGVRCPERKRARHGPGHRQFSEDHCPQGMGGFDTGPCTLSAATTAARRQARVRGHQAARLTTRERPRRRLATYADSRRREEV